MLRALRYKNFKRYSDVILDTSKLLTVLVGPNSSGKSSLLKGLLAFKQTYGDTTDHAGFVSEGEYVDIGPFEEYSKDHEQRGQVEFVFEVTIPERDNAIPSLVFRRTFISIVHAEDPQSRQGRMVTYSLWFTDDEEISIDKYESIKECVRFYRMQTAEEIFRMDVSRELLDSIYTKGGKFLRNEQFDFEAMYAKLENRSRRGKIRATRDNQRGMMLRVANEYTEDNLPIYLVVNFLVQPAHEELHLSLTKKLFALAGLRQKPTRSVRRTDESSTVGSSGQNTASVYADLRQKYIKAGSTRASRARDNFARLERWLVRLGLARSLELGSWRDLVDMRTTKERSGKSDSVVDIGVGFSQAAPLLVQMAAMPDECMLLVEQPELHLFPRSQTGLGQLLCEEALRGRKNIIVETHSEHIIHGIQLHLSNGRIGNSPALRASDIQVIYIDEGPDLVRLELDEYGEFRSGWPSGFFDQTLSVYQTIFANKSK